MRSSFVGTRHTRLAKHKKPELVKRLEDKINGNPNNPATASSTEDPVPMLEEESSEGGAGVKSGDEEGVGHVFEQSYD